MKTNEKLNAFTNEAEALNRKPAELTDEEISQVSGGSYEGSTFEYIIQPGDCLSVLAHRYGTTVKILCELNGITNPNLIYTYDILRIPLKT